MSRPLQSPAKAVKPSWRDHKKIYPACDVFPPMSLERLRELADDIRANGLKVLIEVRHADNGEFVVDGKNRLDSLELVGEQLINAKGDWTHRAREFIHFGGKHTDAEIIAEVVAYNNRRDLTESQRAMAAAKLATMTHGGDRRSDQAASMQDDRTSVPQAAKMLDVGERTVRQAKKVLREAPEQVPAIESGEARVGAVLRKTQPTKRQRKPKPDKKAQRVERLAELQQQQGERIEQIHAMFYWGTLSQDQRERFVNKLTAGVDVWKGTTQ